MSILYILCEDELNSYLHVSLLQNGSFCLPLNEANIYPRKIFSPNVALGCFINEVIQTRHCEYLLHQLHAVISVVALSTLFDCGHMGTVEKQL